MILRCVIPGGITRISYARYFGMIFTHFETSGWAIWRSKKHWKPFLLASQDDLRLEASMVILTPQKRKKNSHRFSWHRNTIQRMKNLYSDLPLCYMNFLELCPLFLGYTMKCKELFRNGTLLLKGFSPIREKVILPQIKNPHLLLLEGNISQLFPTWYKCKNFQKTEADTATRMLKLPASYV